MRRSPRSASGSVRVRRAPAAQSASRRPLCGTGARTGWDFGSVSEDDRCSQAPDGAFAHRDERNRRETASRQVDPGRRRAQRNHLGRSAGSSGRPRADRASTGAAGRGVRQFFKESTERSRRDVRKGRPEREGRGGDAEVANAADGRINFDVAVLEGEIPANADGQTFVFIDIIELPCTPVSFAGAARPKLPAPFALLANE